MSATEIARMLLTDESQVRKVIHDFNERGWESLRPRFRGGRPRRIQIDDEQRIVAVAGACPDSLGVPLTRWSLSKLSGYLRRQGIEVSRPRKCLVPADPRAHRDLARGNFLDRGGVSSGLRRAEGVEQSKQRPHR